MPRNTGSGSSSANSRAAVFLYGSVTPEEAANYWYDRAMETAKAMNRLEHELNELRRSRIVRLVERYK